MSKFQSTVSTVAALASIFGAGAAGWKLAADSQHVPEPAVEERVAETETKVADPVVTATTQPVAPPPVTLPEVSQTVTPSPVTLPPAPTPVAPPPPVTETTQP